MPSIVQGSAAYKKKDGTLNITEDQKSIVWKPLGAQSNEKMLVIAVTDITNLQQTPESAAKAMLRIIEKSPSSSESITHQFHFNSPTNPRVEANSIKDVLTVLISAIKAKEANILKPSTSDTSSLGVVSSSITGFKTPTAVMFDDAHLKANIELQQSVMKIDPSLHRTYMESRSNKPDSISDSQFNSQFWSTRTHLLRAHAIELRQKRGAYNVLSAVKPRQVDGELKMNISSEQVQLIFSQHPLVKHVYDENVPKLNEMEFWSRFFLSRLFKKLKGERILEGDVKDPVFDRYMDANNDSQISVKKFSDNVPHIIDLAGNEENQGGSKAETGKILQCVLLQQLSLSEKIMAHVAPSDIDPSAPIGMDEETFSLLALRDLQGNETENKIVLNIKEQSRFFSDGKGSLSSEAEAYAQQIPSEILAGLLTDVNSAVMNSEAGCLDLSLAIGVREDSDTEDESEVQNHVGSRLSLLDAQNQVLEAIKTRRHETDGSGAQPSSLGLSQQILDRLILTHATTIEFVHHFWSLFLSGDSERAGELAKLVETLEKAVDRIDAVANDAELERHEIIAKQKNHIKEVYKASGRKIQWSATSVLGGSSVVKAVVEPTIKAIQKAVREYKKALETEMTEALSKPS
ncbi:putative RNA polymerase II transcription factor B subunit 1 [Blumeria hordei DH14]|uniref:Putative RNA polymerase II transcription factor B subunit 1 n=1 Tax=Blumeria graminis f. sp. hordei (strain DH14) TaxID=546991 RepID=N1J7M0_BLUG1|nr:putative RNA polymerase II transcription factor B subunit 1 [Blumeria hordei DH14]